MHMMHLELITHSKRLICNSIQLLVVSTAAAALVDSVMKLWLHTVIVGGTAAALVQSAVQSICLLHHR